LYSPTQYLHCGTALIGGGGSSGAYLGLEPYKDREVILAISHKLKFLPFEIFRKSMIYWLEKLQLLYAGTDTIRSRLLQKRNDPIFGRELKQAITRRNVNIKPRVTEVAGKNVTLT